MFIANVVGTVWSTKKVKSVENLKFLIVHQKGLDTEPNTNIVIVADILGAGIGEDVICAYGQAARTAIHPDAPDSIAIEAAVIGIIDSLETDSSLIKK